MKVEGGIPITKFSYKSLSTVEDLKQLQTPSALPNETPTSRCQLPQLL